MTNETLFACTIANSAYCRLFTTNPNGFTESQDEDGNTQRCCAYCNPPLTPEEEAEARAEFGDEWDSLA